MSDICDIAAQEEAMHITALIKNQVGKGSTIRQTPIATGNCAWCGDKTEISEDIFCSEECAVDWQQRNAKQERLNRINGDHNKI